MITVRAHSRPVLNTLNALMDLVAEYFSNSRNKKAAAAIVAMREHLVALDLPMQVDVETFAALKADLRFVLEQSVKSTPKPARKTVAQIKAAAKRDDAEVLIKEEDAYALIEDCYTAWSVNNPLWTIDVGLPLAIQQAQLAAETLIFSRHTKVEVGEFMNWLHAYAGKTIISA